MENDWKLSSYDYDLPKELIAERPLANRDDCKLLVYQEKNDQIIHSTFRELHKFLSPNTLLVFNNSRVLKARLLGNKFKKNDNHSLGGKCELMWIKNVSPYRHIVLIKCRGVKKIADQYLLANGKYLASITKILSSEDLQGFFEVEFFDLKEKVQEKVNSPLDSTQVTSIFESYGLIPIPQYIRRGQSDSKDNQDYQTVYASTDEKDIRSIAAPTAGLHFTNEVLTSLTNAGIERTEVTLHVGAGTFSPVRTENILEHKMHSEVFYISPENYQKILQYQNNNIIAVGTTSLRVLESVSDGFKSINAESTTDIFLYPGKEIKSVTGMITNFHLPKSTLIMLVSALIGREKILSIYAEAIKNNYRFFSYGDAMLILRG
ncbi:MAG: tRNA preQ1(34) S-adenosylmethionine ribosyltransferase-isomerase QueA [Oligoflexia bacterium]|nr:tRNA preQ1(34) S-adenosylmethionine ribosyltransferase-isomerase QueA [Oligoflexia bacterium]